MLAKYPHKTLTIPEMADVLVYMALWMPVLAQRLSVLPRVALPCTAVEDILSLSLNGPGKAHQPINIKSVIFP